jgi:hypothetical protein
MGRSMLLPYEADARAPELRALFDTGATRESGSGEQFPWDGVRPNE